jgi:hypothetical protein
MASAIGTPMKVPNSRHRKVQNKITTSATIGETDRNLPTTHGSTLPATTKIL